MDKIINDVPLKGLSFQTRQKKWDGGSNYHFKDLNIQIKGLNFRIRVKNASMYILG